MTCSFHTHCRHRASLLLLAICVTVRMCVGMGCSHNDGRRFWHHPQNHSHVLQAAFPPGFLWGVGTSAFQMEGSWDLDGKSPSVWDHFTHRHPDGHDRGMVMKTADRASEGYALWKEDVELVRYLGVQFYAFSLSWPRLFPDGLPTGPANQAAVEHYRRLIGRLRLRGLEPVVTLFHWDLPQVLQERYGGWRNDSMVEVFADYAGFCFTTFGAEVRHWLTMYNPFLVALQGYGRGVHAPGETGGTATSFTVAHNLIRAHARAWHVYNTKFRSRQNGKVSITLGSHWVEPFKGQATPNNVELCKQSMEAVIGWFAEPIHGGGDYPSSLKASNQGLIPEFTPEERHSVRGTADFFSLAFGPDTLRVGHGLPRFGQMVSLDLQKLLGWIQCKYGDPEVLVAESGWFSSGSVGVEDTVAIYLMKRFINQVLRAISLDGVKVFGYTAWSLVDGFEWNYGYSVRRGLFYVDFNDPKCTRVPKTTAKFYREVVKHNRLPSAEATQDIKGHFPCDFQFGVVDSILQVHLRPFSPQFTDPHLYGWNFSGDGALRPVAGVTLQTRGSQCSDFIAIRRHMHLLEVTKSSDYRFALDWPLLLPHGDLSKVNSEAMHYYRCILKELQRKGIRASVTLFHPSHKSPTLGMPRPLQARGGWMNQSIVEAFEGYAELCYRELGTWVSGWVTINEPNRLVDAYNGSATGRQQIVRNLLLAHARAWRIYDMHFRQQQHATVSLALHADWVEPANPFVESHAKAAQRFLLFELGRFLGPLLSNDDFPDEVRDFLEGQRQQSGEPINLSYFTVQEKAELRGALDFIALNHFTTHLVAPLSSSSSSSSDSSTNPDHGCLFLSDPTWSSSGLGQSLVPWGLRRILRWVKGQYGDTSPIVVTATGVDDQASHDDRLRQSYIRSYLQEALKARELDGVDLRGLYVWRLQDHHTPQFGLFTSSSFQSRPKGSVKVYREIIGHRGFPGPDATGSPCQLGLTGTTGCTFCAHSQSTPLLFFSVCVVVSACMLCVMLVITVLRRRSKGRGEVPIHIMPPAHKRQQRFAMQRVMHRTLAPRV